MSTDTRPRFRYRLPDGTAIRVIHDHGEQPKPFISYEVAPSPHPHIGRSFVTAELIGEDLAERAFRRADNDGAGEFK